jgi:DNA topoisomerase-3
MEKVKSEEEAKQIAAACDGKQAAVSLVKKERKTVNPPKLYDLTTLQREANRFFGFTAQQTLDLVQSLYEKKLLTYPRTDSQFLTEDMEGTAKSVLTLSAKAAGIHRSSNRTDIRRVMNNSKVSDHMHHPDSST